MGIGWISQMEYQGWVDRQRLLRVPAADQEKTECVKCGFCCARRTCVPQPDELDAIAKFLECTVEELVDGYLVGDRYDGASFMRFANKKQRDITGEFLPPHRSFDRDECILFQEGEGCLIYPVQPSEPVHFECWTNGGKGSVNGSAGWKEGDLERLGPNMKEHQPRNFWDEDEEDEDWI